MIWHSLNYGFTMKTIVKEIALSLLLQVKIIQFTGHHTLSQNKMVNDCKFAFKCILFSFKQAYYCIFCFPNDGAKFRGVST